MLNLLKGSFIFALVCIFSMNAHAQFYTGSQQDFGKNRVQFNGFYWQYYNFERFQTYFYPNGEKLAEYTAKSAHKYLNEMEKYFDFYIDGQLQFIIYQKQSHFKQSNIGLSGDEQHNIGGVTRIVGSKIFLYYEGDHKKLDDQIRSGIAQVLVNQMMYGGNWKDVLKNSTLLTLPKWYLEGFISFSSRNWDAEIDNSVKDGIISGRYEKFNRLEGVEAKYAGHSIWNYIAEVYGENMIPNILYMTRISRNIESGFLFVLGVSLRTLSDDYVAYYKKRYTDDEKFRIKPEQKPLEVKTKSSRTYSQFKVSPDGRYAAWVSNELGQYKIWTYHIRDKKLKKVYKGDHKLDRITDLSFPVLTWHPTSKALAFITEEKGGVKMHIHQVSKGKTTSRDIKRLDKVLDMAYADDGKTMIFSAVYKGQTDLFLYRVIGNSQTQLTNDIFDDLTPRFIDNSTRVIFASNRVDDTLRTKVPIKQYNENNDIFILDLGAKNGVLTRITNSPLVNESQPSQYDTIQYTYLSDQNGINNRYIAYYDSTISHVDTIMHYRYFTKTSPVTDYSRSILMHEFAPKKGRYSQLMFKDGKYDFYIGKVENDKTLAVEKLRDTRFIESRNALIELGLGSDTTSTLNNLETFETKDKDSTGVNINNYLFDDDKPKYEKEVIRLGDDPDSTTVVDNTPKVDDEFVLPRRTIYKINFATDYVVSQIDNSFLNQTYQRYTGPGAVYFNPGFNGLIKLGVSDLFEDYRIVGGLRYSGDLNSNEYMLSYENLADRLDKRYILHRQAFLGTDNFSIYKLHTHEAKFMLKWAFSEVASLRGSLSYRNDRQVTLSTDFLNLQEPNTYFHLLGSKLEYVYDNTIKKGLNLYNGTRLKVFGEYYQGVNPERESAYFENLDFFVVGADIRHYTKIHRDIIWANRIAGSTSFGSQRLVYYLGGVDDWLFPKFDNTVQVAEDQGYTYQTIATPMRGFFQNARNGNSFAVINSELRVPVFKYFVNRPIKNDFLENFQVLGFGDIGTAWTGPDPYSQENSFNVETVPAKPLLVTIQNQREPIIAGYGFGLRSRIFGYFIRFDMAWGVDDGVVLEPIKYLSLSLDF
jgi:Tol biopolymer transport system component